MCGGFWDCLCLWEWSPAGHMVRAFVDVIRAGKNRSTERKERKVPLRPTERFPSGFPGAQRLLLGLDAAAAASPELHLDRLFRGAPRSLLLRAGLSAWLRGLGDGGCVRAVRCGGRCVCSTPQALRCFVIPGCALKPSSRLSPRLCQPISPGSVFPGSPEEFRKTHGHK